MSSATPPKNYYVPVVVEQDGRGERSFAALLAAMNQGKSFAAALDATYGLDEQLLQERWRADR